MPRPSRIAAAVLLALTVLLIPIGAPRADGTATARPEEGEIERLYRAVLARAPDDGGFAYWVAARVEGVPLGVVAGGFLNSPEYGRRFGQGSDAVFVDRAYRNVLARPGEPAGVEYWLGLLAGGLPRTELVLLFSESPEHRVRTGTVPAELPPFRPSVRPVDRPDVAHSWRPGCPVGPERLRAVEVDHVDFDGNHRRGTLVVNADVVDDIVVIFDRLYRARYPIAGIAPVDFHLGDDNASMAANNTSAFNCRRVTGGRSWSRHAYGTAIDINPVQNPYVNGGVVLPPDGHRHLDRSAYHPAMIRPGDVVTTAFAAVGWRWGGNFRTLRDYQHFEVTRK